MRAAEQDRPDVAAARAEWAQNQSELDPERLVFIDETGTSTNMARQRGRSPRGERLIGKVPHGHWKTTERQAAIGRSASFGCRKAFRSVHAVALRIVHGQLPVAPCPVSRGQFAPEMFGVCAKLDTKARSRCLLRATAPHGGALWVTVPRLQ
jgi:hypothetical protein